MAKFEAFNTQDYEDVGTFQALEESYYYMQAVANEMKATKNGMMLVIEFEVCDGEHNGRKIFENYNLVNPSTAAVTIARRALATFQRACGLGDGALDDADVLMARPFWGHVKVIPAQGQYKAKNGIDEYLTDEQYAALNEESTPTPAPVAAAPVKPATAPVRAPVMPAKPVAAAPSQAPAATGAKKAPWRT